MRDLRVSLSLDVSISANSSFQRSRSNLFVESSVFVETHLLIEQCQSKRCRLEPLAIAAPTYMLLDPECPQQVLLPKCLSNSCSFGVAVVWTSESQPNSVVKCLPGLLSFDTACHNSSTTFARIEFHESFCFVIFCKNKSRLEFPQLNGLFNFIMFFIN